MTNRNITIIGGNGAMGQLFKQYWEGLQFQVSVLSESDWVNADQLLREADLVVVSVPISLTSEIIAKTAQYISRDCILVDFTSIKQSPIESMLKFHSGSVIGLHPMFGPTIASPKNQVVINCGGRVVSDCAWVLNSLADIGFKIVDMEPKKHDEVMGFIQGIEHFSTFALGKFLYKHSIDIDELFMVSSPIYQTKLALLGRVFDQDPKLYADIIMSDKSRIDLITEYIDYLQSLKSMLTNRDKDKFINDFNAVTGFMGEFTEKAQKSTDEFLTIK